ncbi:hypothetical protein KQX54_000296 [Cotesia glomerata]|uniref:Uncharacterized protein n=1 Tax=Cotesia glomerata TaxID=32391 RepID=A0AAV7HR04_COTGL|nr:hypothetical protein KQX54_000296 [Cotesia glomerata]
MRPKGAYDDKEEEFEVAKAKAARKARKQKELMSKRQKTKDIIEKYKHSRKIQKQMLRIEERPTLTDFDNSDGIQNQSHLAEDEIRFLSDSGVNKRSKRRIDDSDSKEDMSNERQNNYVKPKIIINNNKTLGIEETPSDNNEGEV